MAKKKFEKVDGLGRKNVEQIRKALRQVWSWSHARKLVVKRCTDSVTGLATCEKCEQGKLPRIFVDHVVRCGDVDRGYIERLFVPSSRLQGLCKKCHDKKTRQEREEEIW